ncbi:MAG: ribokinase [Pseudomonadota bacterium]
MVIVLGSINADGVMKTASLPIEGETRVDGEYSLYPGGKGANQAVAARHAGAGVAFIGAVGDDELAEPALAGLRDARIDISQIARRTDASTGYAIVMVNDSGQNAIVVASGANRLVTADQLPADWLNSKITVVLQAEIPMQVNAAAARTAKQNGARTILNLAPYATPGPGLLEAIDILILNEIEAAQLAADRGDTADFRSAAQTVAHEFGTTVILTLGADGAVAFVHDAVFEMPALPITPTDTTGAGDAFVGALAAALDNGMTIEDALRRATTAGSLACLKLGAQSALPSRDDIERMLIKGN